MITSLLQLILSFALFPALLVDSLVTRTLEVVLIDILGIGR